MKEKDVNKKDISKEAGNDEKDLSKGHVTFSEYFHPEDKKLKEIALLGAIIVHVLVFFLRFPSFGGPLRAEQKPENVIYVRKYIPPPPKIEKPKQQAPKKLTKKVPIPDPTPDEPEPIREPEPEPEIEPLPPDVEILIGEPEAPPQQGPLIAGIGDVTYPERIPESYVKPIYPDLARKAKIEGLVILQIIVRKDGTVGNITVLRAPSARLGFEESAVDAVKRWRYKPAMQSGRPVDVYLTVQVAFELK